MRTSKKNVFRLITMLLLVGMFVSACSGGQGGSNGSDPSGTGGGDDGQKPITLYYYHEQPFNPSSNAVRQKVHQEILERSGYDLQVIPRPSSSPEDKLNIMLGSQEDLDVFLEFWHSYQSRQAIQPLNEWVEKYGSNIMAAWPEESWKGLQDNEGNIWALPRGTPVAGHPIFIRQDWLDQYGLSFPETLDELEHVLEVFKTNDPAGNGQTIPFISRLTTLNFSVSSGFTGVGYGMYVDDDGKVKPTEVHPGYRDFVERMADWYRKGYFSKENFGLELGQVRELNGQGRVGVSADWITSVTINALPNLQENNPGADFTYRPEGIRGPAGLLETIRGVQPNGYMVPAYSDNAEHVVKLFDWAYADPENYLLLEYGIRGEHWDWVDREAGIITVLVDPADPNGYNKDYALARGIPNESIVMVEGERNIRHIESMRPDGMQLEYDRGERPLTWEFAFDDSLVQDRVPNMGDIHRMMEEEITKFIMGARPIDEYDTFVEHLYSIGLDEMIEAYTEQYNDIMNQ